MHSERKGNKFVVDFQGEDLPSEVAELLQANIQEAVLRTVARLDFSEKVIFQLPPGTWGMIWDGRFDRIKDFPR